MAKNELVSLGLVYNAPMHAYAIKCVVKEMGLEHWAKISSASIYNTLARLEKQGFVGSTMEKKGNMPQRKVYKIAEEGKKQLRKELQEALLSCEGEGNLFYLGTMFLYGMPSKEAVALLEQRIEYLEQGIVHMKAEYNNVKKYNVTNAMITIQSGLKHTRLEIQVTKDFIAMLKKEPDVYKRLGGQLKMLCSQVAR